MSIRRKKDTTNHLAEHLVAATSDAELDLCSCPPVSSLCLLTTTQQKSKEQEWSDEEHSQVLPIPPALNAALRTRLQTLFPSVSAVSVLLLHVSQFEHIHITPTMEIVHKRKRYHPTTPVMEQILTNVRRAIRMEDSVYLDAGKGAAIIFPDVDQEGAYTILERVFNSVNLLQAETIIPPLTHETDIVLGIGSYPQQGPSLEHVLACAGRVEYRLTLRPAITMRSWDERPLEDSDSTPSFDHSEQDDESIQPSQKVLSILKKTNTLTPLSPPSHDAPSVPFLRLPSTLSVRLKNLLSYKLATQFHCVPMGRDHNRLTIAMADPTDSHAVQKLREITGMTIFPVACDNAALDALLAEKW